MENPENQIWIGPFGARRRSRKRPTSSTTKARSRAEGLLLLESGAIAANRVKGRGKEGKEKKRGQWVSTPRLIRDSLLPSA